MIKFVHNVFIILFKFMFYVCLVQIFVIVENEL